MLVLGSKSEVSDLVSCFTCIGFDGRISRKSGLDRDKYKSSANPASISSGVGDEIDVVTILSMLGVASNITEVFFKPDIYSTPRGITLGISESSK